MSLNLHPSHPLLLDRVPALPPGNEFRTPVIYSSQASFDTNMVIILAALLCALICVLGLNFIVRCAFTCSRRFSFESNEVEARMAARGLKKTALLNIPVSVYGSGTNIPATDCPICLGEFLGGEKVRVLPKCHHGFHVSCIDMWLASHSSCPTCRQSLMPASFQAKDVEGGRTSHGHASGGHGDAPG